MRRLAPLLLIALVVVFAWTPAAMAADNPSISRDARGSQPTGDYGPLGSPPTPGLYLLGQTTIFAAGVSLLVIAAALGAYTMISSRRSPPRR